MHGLLFLKYLQAAERHGEACQHMVQRGVLRKQIAAGAAPDQHDICRQAGEEQYFRLISIKCRAEQQHGLDLREREQIIVIELQVQLRVERLEEGSRQSC